MPCGTITIEGKPANVYVDSIDVPSSAYVGETFTVTATVVNDGGSSGAGTVRFTQEGSDIGSGYVEVGPGESKYVDLDHSISTSGDYRICASYSSGF